MDNSQYQIIRCPECNKFPFLQIILKNNDNHLLFYKYHNDKFNCNNYSSFKIENNLKNQKFIVFILKLIKIIKYYIENNLWLNEIFNFLLNFETSIINYLFESENDIFR